MLKGGDMDSGRKLSGRDFGHNSSGGLISYEDLLIAQYLEEMKKSRIEVKKDRDLPASPYLQKLPHSNTITMNIKYQMRRPASAAARIAPREQHEKPKIDAKFIADHNLWDPETPRSEKHIRHRRPASAPIKRHGRPQSGASSRYSYRVTSYHGYRPGSAKRPKSLYRRQPHTIRVVAYKNGSRDSFVRATAPNLKMLLECLTTRLGLPFAARRIFLEDGIEVFEGHDIAPDAEVYISMGENYKNPHIPTKRNLILKEGAVWNLSGIILPEEGKKKKTKSRLSKRMLTLIDRKKVRILVYRNGRSTEPMEIVADLAHTDEFLVACTAKLDLRSHARILYDWEGNEISDLTATPILDDCLQHGGTPVMGPLWVSVGEGFSPTGTAHFITSITQVVRTRLREVTKFKKEINYAMSDDEQDKVTIPSIKSMSTDELYDALEKAEADIDQLAETLKRLRDKQEVLRSEQEKEESMGASYKMTHIQELSAEDRLVGAKGLKLKVYENGTSEGSQTFFFNMREALKGINRDDQLMARLLDELSTSHWTSGGVNPKLNAVAQKLYDKYGHEIKRVKDLESEQEIWVSYGEPFICPFSYCIEAFFDEATKLEHEGVTHIVREPLMQEDTAANDEHTQWEATIGFPVMYEQRSNLAMIDADKVKWMTESAEVDERGFYLLHKKRQDLALYPELVVNEKFRLRGDDKRPSESAVRRMKEVQTWVISQSGYIFCKYMPQLCLGVSDVTTKGKFFDQDSEMEGSVVTLQKKMAQNPNQMWRFTSDATIASVAYPDKVLTYLGNKFGDEESYMENPPEGIKAGARVYLIISEQRPRKEGACQRFALKQERFDNLGQWKYTQTTNSEWHKLAYSWPITVSGDLNEKYDWPMEGYLIPHAPPLHKSDKKSGLSGVTPIRLYVMKNGDRDTSFAISIVGPNLTTMIKDSAKKDKKEGGHRHKKQDVVTNHADSVDVDVNLHCRDLTVRELEFIMFLDHCTAMLNMPFAARRLFDATGTEHFTLQSLKRDQLVYVTCGEQWSDPSLTKAEQQRRFLLSQLSTDVAKIRQFVSLRDPQRMVMEVDGGLTPNTNIVINTCWSRDEENEERTRETAVAASQEMEPQDEDDFSNMSPHQRAHLRSDKRMDNLRWPWERLVNVGNSSEDDDPEAVKYSNKDLYDKYKPRPSPRVPRDTLQRFVYEDGFIACSANRGLVLGIQEQEGRVIDVILQKKLPASINQRWVMKENGEIRSKMNQQLALTVATPNILSDDTRPLSFARCQVTLQGRRLNQYGKAHQRWRYDAETGFIHAFYADQYDKEITAANKADVCTFAVSHTAEIDQPGYLVELPDRKNRDVRVCLSCARAMRGRYKVQRLPNNKPFACAMGQAKRLKLRQVGSFCVLNGKVDLSTHEAEITLQNWEESLSTLREETSIKTIAKQISAAKSVKTVKLLVYKNGEGRMRAGVKVYGSSIQGILNQCSHQLELNKPATRLYTEDGVMILDMDDLIDWAVENYKTVMADRIERMVMIGNGDSDNAGSPTPEGGDNSAGGIQSHTQLARAMQNMEKFDEDERGGGDADDQRAGDQGEEEGGETSAGEVKEEKTELDSQEANKVAKQRELLLSQVPLPSLETILRYPIELWVSSGKNFVAPEVVESKDINRRKKRAFRAQVSLDLDIEKHVLRQMKGRRMDELNPGEYRSTLSSTQPVVIEGNWQKLTVQEQIKHDNVHKLQTHLGEIKANQNLGLANVNLKGRLYQQPNMKRVLAYPNGESLERAIYVWGETMDQLLESATQKLALWKKAKIFFTTEGKVIETFEDIERDQLVCVSMGKGFKKPKINLLDVEVKANWGRARKQYGPTATDLTVSAKGNVKVDVDPFGPPELALPLEGPE